MMLFLTPPHKNINIRKKQFISLENSLVVVVSCSLLLLSLLLLFIFSSTSLSQQNNIPGIINIHFYEIIPLTLCFGVSSSIAITLLTSKHNKLFWIVLFLAFATSGITIKEINYFSLIFRYFFIVLFISIGIINIKKIIKHQLNLQQKWAVFLLLYAIFHVMVMPYNVESYFILIAFIFLLFGIMVGAHSHLSSFKLVKDCFKSMTIVATILTLFFAISLLAMTVSYKNGRFCSFYMLPTEFANLYVLFVVSLLWRVIFLERPGTQRKFFISIIAGVGIFLIALSQTRNAIICLFIAMLLFTICDNTRKTFFSLSVVTLFIVSILLLYHNNLDFTGTRLSTAQSTRYEVWKMTWVYIAQKPFTGYGLGASTMILWEYLPTWMKSELANTHNMYLGMWLQIGIGGLVLFLLLNITALFAGLKNLFSSDVSAHKKKILVLPVTLLTVLLFSFIFEESLTGRPSIVQLVWVLSILSISLFSEKNNEFQ